MLNDRTSKLPVMHCEKGNTYFIYLEETRHGNCHAEERRGNITKDKRTRERGCAQFVFSKCEPLVLFFVKVNFEDTLDSFTDTLELVSLPIGITKV